MTDANLHSSSVCHLTFPGKTFVAGEYLALLGGPALVLSTSPRFALTVRKLSKAVEMNPFHPSSPAGQLWSENKTVLSQFQFYFQDPYRRGGFGASSAQFALLHSVVQFQERIFNGSNLQLNWRSLLQDYRRLGSTEGFPPSGADIVGAAAGQLTLFHRAQDSIQTLAWPFSQTEFFVAHTGHKLATHEHLKTLSQFDASPFETSMKLLKQALLDVNLGLFIEALKQYREALGRNGWIAASTVDKLHSLETNSAASGLLFAKGCGAMGSDVIFALCDKSDSAQVQNLLELQGLKVFASSSQVSAGLQLQQGSEPAEEIFLCP